MGKIKFNFDKVKTAQICSAIFSVLGVISAVGAIFVEDTCLKAEIDEAVDEQLKARGL